jgi:HEXXH motif-containing protein
VPAVHQLDSTAFDRLAAGRGGPDAIRDLRDAQLSRHLVLSRFLLGRWTDPGAGRVRAMLEAARDAAPDRFAEVLGAPLVGGWTAIACRAVEQDPAATADIAYLGALALVACAAAGIDGEVPIPVHSGLAVLPGSGAIEAGDRNVVPARTTGGRIFVDGSAVPVTGTAGWLPVRHLDADVAGLRLRVGLDDLDPYRHGHHVPPALRLTTAEVECWQKGFGEAWALLATRLPERAAEMTVGLRTLVPLIQTDRSSARSATIRHAFGVFGLTRPHRPADFAVTMVHEFQHSKLSALLDQVLLTDPDDERLYFAPWRNDPRPLAGLLQGVYAFYAVADAWRALRGAVADAEVRFAEARLQVDRGLVAIEGSDALTPAGTRFVAGLRRATDELLAEPVSAAADAAGRDTLARTHSAWTERNRR